MSSAGALETLGAGQIPIVGSRPMEWGSRRLQVREKLGVLLLLGMCWAAREDAIEGTVWPHVRDSQALGMFALGGLRPDVLFQQNGAGGLGAAPTALSKNLIRRAVVALGLRHALDCEGVHRWVLTLNLQFAIPVRAFRAGGLDWLRGVGRPQAIEYLLGEQALGGTSVASESLQRTWRCLREFVRGRRDLRETVEILKAHRWASGTDWETMLGELQVARVLDDVPAVEIRPPLSRSDPLVSIGHDQAVRWLVGLSVPPADSSAVPHDQLRLLVGGRQVGVIERREEDDGWHGSGRAPGKVGCAEGFDIWTEFRQALDPWSEIQAAAHGALEPQFVFPVSEEQRPRLQEPILFEPHGDGDSLWIPCGGSRPDRQYLLALPRPLRDVHSSWPGAGGSAVFGDPTAAWTLRRLRSTREPLLLRLGDDVVWRSGDPAASQAQPVPMVVRKSSRRDGGVDLLMEAPPNAVIESAIDEDTATPIDCIGGRCTVLPAAFEPRDGLDRPRSAIPVRLSIRVGQQRRVVRQQVEYPKPHFAFSSTVGLRRHPATETLHVGDFDVPRLIGTRDGNGGMTPFVFEGVAPRSRAASLIRPSGRLNTMNLLGDGRPVDLLGDVVNLTAAGARHRLAARSVNVGVFAPERPEIGDGEHPELRVRLARPGLVPDASWTVEIMTRDGREFASGQFQPAASEDDERLLVRLPTMISVGDLVAVRLVVGNRVRGRWESEDAVASINPQVDARSRWLTMLLWELQPPPEGSGCWHEFVELFRVSPSEVLTPPDDRPLQPSPRPIADLDDRHAALVEQLIDHLAGTAEEASIIDAIAPARPPKTLPHGDRWGDLSLRFVTAVRYSPIFAAMMMKAIDADSSGVVRANDAALRRVMIAEAIRTIDGRGPRQTDDLIARAVGPGSMLAGLFAGSAGGIDPQFVSESIRTARSEFRAGRLRHPALTNLKILCGMTRREGLISRALAAELIHP